MILLVDIDKTLSDAAWRDPLIDSNGWDAYHEQSYLDHPVFETVELVRVLSCFWPVIAVTARPERFRQLTMKWLLQHNVPVTELLLRPNDDYRPSPEVKIALIKERFPVITDFRHFLVIDDREDICVRFKAAGFVAMQVHRRTKNGRQGNDTDEKW